MANWLRMGLGCGLLALAGCGDDAASPTATQGSSATIATATPTPTPTPTSTPRPVASVTIQPVASFTAPWAMTFLPDGRLLVTERPPTGTVLNPIEPGRLHLVTQAGAVSAPIAGLPANVGLFDVKLDPQYAVNHRIYVSFMERDPTAPRVGRDAADPAVDPAGLAVMRGTLTIDAAGTAQVTDASVIWRQTPKIATFPGSGEPGGRMAFSPDGTYLFVAAGDRQELDASILQRLDNTLGKVVRIYPDGLIPADNPYAHQVGALSDIWTWGHRNPYGLAFDTQGLLWENEMGPRGGDELNLLQPASNYGWPLVSYGDPYDPASTYPKPAPGDGFAPAALWWTPVIAPADMIFYSGTVFADWKGDAIIPGLQSQGLVRVRIAGTAATEVQRIPLGARIRAVAQAPDGALWVLEDQPSGRLLKLAPVFQ